MEVTQNLVHGKCFFSRTEALIDSEGENQILSIALPVHHDWHLAERLFELFLRSYNDCCVNLHSSLKLGYKYPLFVGLPQSAGLFSDWADSFKSKVEFSSLDYVSEAHYVSPGYNSGSIALLEASKAIINQDISGAFVCGIDSFIDPMILDIISSQGQLLTRSNPYGLVPGEASSLVFISPEVPDYPERPLLAIDAISQKKDLVVDTPNRLQLAGFGLSSCLKEIFSTYPSYRNSELVMFDLNGSRFKSEEIGSMLASSKELGTSFANPLVLSSSVGDLGSGSSIMMLCVASLFNYVTNGLGIITSSCPEGSKFICATRAITG